jgi:pimeloyl-ACP methyl ester carboxylesterase
MTARGDTVAVDGGHLYYEVRGRGPTVVLIHGGFGDHRMWNAQFEALARDFRVVRYDHRGFGRSSRPEKAYSPVADLLALLDRLEAKTAHLVGNSMGGTLAIDFVLLHPDRVGRLVVVASGANGFPIPPEALEKTLEVFRTAKEKGTKPAAELWLQHPMVAVTSRDPATRGLLRKMVVENREIFLMEHWPDEPMDPQASARLTEVKAPTLLILGERDTDLVDSIGRATAKGIPGARLETVAGADHLPQMDKPVEVGRLLTDFLRP